MALKQILLGTAVALAASAGAAQAAIETPTGWYLSLAAGVNWIEDGKITEFQPPGVLESNNNFSWDTGWIGAAAVGYDFGNHWRAELEVAYRHNDAEGFCTTVGPSCFNSGTDVWELSQMINVFYDLALGGNWEASIGAGVGGNLVAIRPTSAFDLTGAGLTTDEYVFAGQLIGQLAYRFSERWQAYVDYHFMLMENPEFQDPGENEIWEMEKTDHTVMIGLRFDLQRDGAAPPRAAEPPPPSERAREFIVFFGFNKSNLTPEAQRVVHEAAEAARQFGTATILVVGHTDTSGSHSYNLRLSLRRAGAVKSGLAREGIEPDMIRTSGKGETELMVQTGDGVKEPQNRRSTITLQ